MTSEGAKGVIPNEPLSMEPPSSSGVKRKRGRPRKYEYATHELPHRAQPIQSAPPLRSTQDGSNFRHDGVQINHTSGASVAPNMRTIQVLPSLQSQGNRSNRPRDSANLVKTYLSQANNYSTAPLQGNSVKDDIVGKYFVGKMAKKCPGFSLITVKLKDNQVLKGWVPDENNLQPITPKDDLAPELPMLRPSQVRKRPTTIHRQTAPPTMPVHLEDVTFAQPLQMRRPVEKSVAKHTVPPAARPYISSGVIAATPISVSSSNAESRIIPRQGSESLNPQPSSTVLPTKTVQPVLVTCKQVTDQDVFVEGKSVNETDKDFVSSNRTDESSVNAEKLNTALVDVVVKKSPGERELLNVPIMDAVKESSDQIQHDDSKDMDEIKIASGTEDQSNAANSKQENTEQSEQLETILQEVDGSESGARGTTSARGLNCNT